MEFDEFIRGLLAADRKDAAARAVIERFGAEVFRYLCTLHDGDDAEDAFQMWAENVWRGLPAFRWRCSLRAWSYRLAFHAAARLRRDPYRARGERLPSSAASRLAQSIAASTFATGSRREGLRRIRAKLPPEDQTLLTLRVDRELEWKEIAAVLSRERTPVSGVALRKRFERLKTRLAQLAAEEGLLDGDRERTDAARPRRQRGPGQRGKGARSVRTRRPRKRRRD